ncbi:MAG: hypothetical protein R6T83_04345 [Salinibacter sp.]
MSPSDAAVYERGDALNDVRRSSEDAPASEPPLVDRIDVYEFSEDEHWAWLLSLMDDGAELNKHLGRLLDRVYACDPSFYNLRGRRRLRSLLDDLNEARTSVQAYERDIEELAFVFAKTGKIENTAASGAELTLSSVKATYDRAYDLCLYKLDRMSNGWITASNFLISIIMLVVTILFWMEFR